MKIILKGKPISTSHAYGQKGRIRYMTKEARTLKEDYTWQAKNQWRGEVLKDDLEVYIKLFFNNKLRRDWDNWHRLSQDSLQGIVFENDVQIQKATVEKFIDKENPRIEIEIKKFSTEANT